MNNALVGFFEYVTDYIKDTPVTSDGRSMLDLLDKDNTYSLKGTIMEAFLIFITPLLAILLPCIFAWIDT